MNRPAAVGILVVGVALVSYALFSSASDEEQIQALLDDLENAVSFSEPQNPVAHVARLNGAFSDIFAENVVVKISEVGANSTGRRSLGQLGARASAGYQALDLNFAGVSIEAGETAANVSLTAQLKGDRGADMRADQRRAELRFEKIDGDWRIVRVHVTAPTLEDG